MKIDNSQISGRRFLFTIACFLQSSALLISFVSSITKQESWIPIVLAALISIPLIYTYRTLMVLFPDKTLIGMLEEVFGPVLGKILGVICTWFFLTLCALNVSDLGSFTNISIMPETPTIVLTILCVLVASFAVRNGVKVVTRFSSLFTYAEIAILVVSVLFIFVEIQWGNLLPIFQLSPIDYIQSTHIVLTIPFGELIVLLMFTPCVKLTRRSSLKYWFIGVGIGALTLIGVLLRDIAVLGDMMSAFALPSLVTLRLISLGDALNRVEILFAIALIMLLFFKISVIAYATTIAVCELFKTKNYKNLAFITGLFALFYSQFLFKNNIEHSISARSVTPVFWTFFEIIIPVLTLIIAKLRKLGAPPDDAANLPEPLPNPVVSETEVNRAWDGS